MTYKNQFQYYLDLIKSMTFQAKYQQQTTINPYNVFDRDIYDDSDLLFVSDHQNTSARQDKCIDLQSKIQPPDVFLHRFGAMNRNKDLANANTEIIYGLYDGIDIQLSPSNQQESGQSNENQMEIEDTPLSVAEHEFDSSPNFINTTPEISQYSVVQVKVSPQVKVMKSKKQKEAKVAKVGKIPSNLKQKRTKDTQNESQSGRTKKIQKKKKDERKNMYGYSFKFIVKAYLSSDYRTFFNNLCTKVGVDGDQVKKFYSQKLAWSISLKDLRGLLNYQQHGVGSQLRKIKQSFHKFYVWFMRKRYTIHILTEDKIVHKQPYLEAKNYLIYLPKIKVKRRKESSNQQCSSIDEQ